MRPALAVPLLVLLVPPTALAEGLVSGPWVQQVTETWAWILWEGDPEAVVEWGPYGSLGRQTQATSSSGEIQEALLAGLEPGSRYDYQLRHADGTSDTFTFRTAKAGQETSVRFVVVSDTQRDGARPDQWRETVEDGIEAWSAATWGAEPDEAIDLVLVVGDLVSDGWEVEQWRDEFLAPARSLMARVPFYPVIGNHEANSDLYFDRFHLPENGDPDWLEHWWFLDRANVRFVGLDSNPPYTGSIQQDWLAAVLEDACTDERIDFVVAALHHPWQSELWPPGEAAFPGVVIEQLDAFATGCGKPALHLFGHTHGYSRGQSRDAPHTQVNVATASGDIDEWGEYEQIDYDAFQISLDEYGFVVVEVNAGDDPAFRLRRIGRGDASEPADNVERDALRIRRFATGPAQPEARSPDTVVPPRCIQLAASPYCDAEDDPIGASHWQVAERCDDFSAPVHEAWVQHENVYDDEDRQAGDHLGDLLVMALEPEGSWCWRVRYRDRSLAWSPWSAPTAFETSASTLGDNLLTNPGAEDGTTGWVADGPLEALEAGACEDDEPYEGDRYLSIGGACEPGLDPVQAAQEVDLAAWATEADAGALAVLFGGQVSGDSEATIELGFLGDDGSLLGTTALVGGPSEAWVQLEGLAWVPVGTRALRFGLWHTPAPGTTSGTRYDELALLLDTEGTLGPCLEPPAYPWPDEATSCEDSGIGPDSDTPGEEPRRCGCAGAAGGGSAVLAWLGCLALGVRRRFR